MIRSGHNYQFMPCKLTDTCEAGHASLIPCITIIIIIMLPLETDALFSTRDRFGHVPNCKAKLCSVVFLLLFSLLNCHCYMKHLKCCEFDLNWICIYLRLHGCLLNHTCFSLYICTNCDYSMMSISVILIRCTAYCLNPFQHFASDVDAVDRSLGAGVVFHLPCVWWYFDPLISHRSHVAEKKMVTLCLTDVLILVNDENLSGLVDVPWNVWLLTLPSECFISVIYICTVSNEHFINYTTRMLQWSMPLQTSLVDDYARDDRTFDLLVYYIYLYFAALYYLERVIYDVNITMHLLCVDSALVCVFTMCSHPMFAPTFTDNFVVLILLQAAGMVTLCRLSVVYRLPHDIVLSKFLLLSRALS